MKLAAKKKNAIPTEKNAILTEKNPISSEKKIRFLPTEKIQIYADEKTIFF